MIAIGIDQSTTFTGLCMARFQEDGTHEVIKALTIETPGYIEMRYYLRGFCNHWTPTVVIAEDGFKGCNVSTTITAAWVEAIVLEHKIGELFAKVSASEWRKKVWPDAGKVKCEKCHGFRSIDTQLSLDDWLPEECPDCKGKGFTTKKMLSADWKAHGIAEAVKDDIVDPDDHQGDARGLMLYGKLLYLERMNDGPNET